MKYASSAAAATVVSFAGSRAFAATRVSSVYGPDIVFNIPNYIPIEMGYAKDEGLDLKLEVFNAGTQIRDALASGQAEFAMTDAVNALQLENRGKPTKLLLSVADIPFYGNYIIRKDLYDQGITSLEKLADWKRPDGGKPIIGITAIGGSIYTLGTYVFEKLNAAEKVTWVGLGSTNAMLGALASKQVDLIPGTLSMIIDAQEKGWGVKVFDVTDNKNFQKYIGGGFPGLTFMTLDDTINSNPDTVQAYVNAYYRGMKWLKDASVEEIYSRFVPKYISDLSPDASKRDIEYMKKIWNYNCVISPDTYENGGKIWFRKEVGIKPIAYKDAVAPKFMENAVAKYG
jgi:NitT/TauT family transport system substrate-binding protein